MASSDMRARDYMAYTRLALFRRVSVIFMQYIIVILYKLLKGTCTILSFPFSQIRMACFNHVNNVVTK